MILIGRGLNLGSGDAERKRVKVTAEKQERESGSKKLMERKDSKKELTLCSCQGANAGRRQWREKAGTSPMSKGVWRLGRSQTTIVN